LAQVREALKTTVLQFLAPLPTDFTELLSQQAAALNTPQYAEMQKGWPLGKSVVDRELMAIATRVPGVLSVNDVLIAEGTKAAESQIRMVGLELPRVMGISVTAGEALSLDELRGQGAAATWPFTTGDGTGVGGDGLPGGGGGTVPTSPFLPVPVIPEEC
jgi:hypothetical protein